MQPFVWYFWEDGFFFGNLDDIDGTYMVIIGDIDHMTTMDENMNYLKFITLNVNFLSKSYNLFCTLTYISKGFLHFQEVYNLKNKYLFIKYTMYVNVSK